MLLLSLLSCDTPTPEVERVILQFWRVDCERECHALQTLRLPAVWWGDWPTELQDVPLTFSYAGMAFYSPGWDWGNDTVSGDPNFGLPDPACGGFVSSTSAKFWQDWPECDSPPPSWPACEDE